MGVLWRLPFDDLKACAPPCKNSSDKLTDLKNCFQGWVGEPLVAVQEAYGGYGPFVMSPLWL